VRRRVKQRKREGPHFSGEKVDVKLCGGSIQKAVDRKGYFKKKIVRVPCRFLLQKETQTGEPISKSTEKSGMSWNSLHCSNGELTNNLGDFGYEMYAG